MSLVTDPVILDSTGQDIVTQLAIISAALAAGNVITGNTDTTLSGVLQGANGKVAVKPVDSAPTADSTNLVSSGGTDKAIKARMPVYGMGKNLLDNWYFRNPVNQRGQSSYSTDGAYTIDRWKLGGAVGTASFDSTGALMSNKTLIGNWFETSRVISGAAYTISVLWSNGLITATGTLTIGAGASGWQISYGTAIDPRTIAIRQVNANAFQFILVGDGTSKAIAAKVELGTEQTLAHQENGVWVLNEIPDYSEELRKCQRYFVRYSQLHGYPFFAYGSANNATVGAVSIPLPVSMRPVAPTVTFSGTIKLRHGSVIGASAPNVTAFQDVALYGNSLGLSAVVSDGLTIGENCFLQIRENTSYLDISCEL